MQIEALLRVLVLEIIIIARIYIIIIERMIITLIIAEVIRGILMFAECQ